ncbi:hypothetical protein EC973_007592 [Apophysomyces ossiformis]|uniref:Uncharacterized protein n=1 Tax=Apophysomyces ossiformis TaxID=679940 RepID=A0A8H7BD37_9FUNG|nr:hypothetical protein EC973_007592 [Apophysomyces ossiformis]
MDLPSSQDATTAQLQELVQQVARQQAVIEQLLASSEAAQSVPEGTYHNLATRPHYEWQADPALRDLMPTLDRAIFAQTLSDEERKMIIDRYPPLSGLKYSPPATLPQAERHFSRGQKLEDQSLRALQYATSAILRPLDVLGHVLFPLLPVEHRARVFAILNDARTLTLHVAGQANTARNSIALRAVNPSYSLQLDDKDYTMNLECFKDTVSTNAAFQKTIKDARPARPGKSSSFFRGVPPLGGGGQPDFTSTPRRMGPPSNKRKGANQSARPQSSQTRSNNPFRNNLANGTDSQ